MSRTIRSTYRVADREGLACLLREVITEAHGGVVSGAARALAEGKGAPRTTGKQQPTFGAIQRSLSRLVNQKSGGITDDTFNLLGRLVPRSQHPELHRCVLSRGAQVADRLYQSWLARSTRRSQLVGDAEMGVGLFGEETEFDYQREQDELRSYLRETFPSHCERLDTALLQRGHLQARGDLAWERVMGPLLCYILSGGIERSWSDLSKDEMRQYLKAGIDQEVILLDRASDVERAQRSAPIIEALHPSLRP